jgi:large repetitive protein
MTFNSNDGTYVLDHIPAGRVDLEASASGYSRATLNAVEVDDGKTTAGADIRLDPAAHVIGRVTAQDGTALAGVYVTAIETGARRDAGLDTAMTDANGDYALTSVPAGDRRIAFTKTGFVRQEKSFTAEVGKDARVDAMLDRGLDLRGRVVDEAGQGVAGANVRVQSDAESSGSTRTDPDGGFVISGLGDLRYAVVAQRNGYMEARLDDISPAATSVVTLTLHRGGTITGHVSGAVSTDFAPVMVMVHGVVGIAPNGRADASGNFTIVGVPDGHFTVVANAVQSGGAPRTSPPVAVDVVNGSAGPVEITFKDGFTIQGRVTVNGRPVNSGSIRFTPTTPSEQAAGGQISGDGTYGVAGVTAGSYQVGVSLPSSDYGYGYGTRYTASGSGVFDIDIPAGSLNGRVTDAQSGAPVPDAQIILSPTRSGAHRQGATDSQGSYSFDPMTEGSWRLNIQKDGYQAVVREITVSGPTNVDVQLTAGSKLTVHVIDAIDGHPVAASIALIDSSGHLTYHTTSGTDGIAEVWAPPETYSISAGISVSSIGAGGMQYVSEPLRVTLPAADVQLRMIRTGRVVVRWTTAGVMKVGLAGPFTAPPPGVGGIVTGMLLSATGVFENLRPGLWKARLIGRDGKPAAEQPVTVASGQTATVVFP